MDEDEELTPEAKGNIRQMMMEIHFAAPELDDFIKWAAMNDDFEDDEITVVLGAVYSYARNKNDPERGEGGGSEPDQS